MHCCCTFLAGAQHHAAVILPALALPWWFFFAWAYAGSFKRPLKIKCYQGSDAGDIDIFAGVLGCVLCGSEMTVQIWQHVSLHLTLPGLAPGTWSPESIPPLAAGAKPAVRGGWQAPTSTNYQCTHEKTPDAKTELLTREPFYLDYFLPVK